MSENSSFNITRPNQYLAELVLPQYEDFISDHSSPRKALLTIILVNHIYDWVHLKSSGKDGFLEHYPKEKKLSVYIDAIRQIANGTKHFKVKPVKTSVGRGFSTGFSFGFAKPLMVNLEDGSTISADALLEHTIDFWKRELGNTER